MRYTRKLQITELQLRTKKSIIKLKIKMIVSWWFWRKWCSSTFSPPPMSHLVCSCVHTVCRKLIKDLGLLIAYVFNTESQPSFQVLFSLLMCLSAHCHLLADCLQRISICIILLLFLMALHYFPLLQIYILGIYLGRNSNSVLLFLNIVNILYFKINTF